MKGKEIRMRKLFSYGKPVIVAIDHGQYFGPIENLVDLKETLPKIYNADGILMTPFVLSYLKDYFSHQQSPFKILRVNWTTALCIPWGYKISHTTKVIDPEQALSLGADIIIANLTLQNKDEKIDMENVKVLTEISRKKEAAGIPLIVEIIPLIPLNEKKKLHTHVKETVRIAWELGADMIKTYYTGENFNEVVEGVPIPVFVLGGEKMKDEKDALALAQKASEKGADGIVFGRNVFQSSNPVNFIENLKAVINGKKYTQLKMHLYDLENLQEINLPPDYEIRTFKKGDEKIWCRIVNETVGGNLKKDDFIKRFSSKKQFDPEGLFFLYYKTKPCGTVLAWKEDKNLGVLHYLGILPEHTGKNLGYMLSLYALKYFRKKEIKEIFLTTDDFRLPAIKIYLKLGFKPVILDEFHLRRWNKILSILKIR